MKKVLIACAGREGQTPAIAEALARRLSAEGLAPVVRDLSGRVAAEEAAGAWDYDATLLAAPVARGGLPAELSGFFMRHAVDIRSRPSAFVTVSLLAASHDAHELAGLREVADRFLFELGWHPECVEHVAGAVSDKQREMLAMAGDAGAVVAPPSMTGMMSPVAGAGSSDITDWPAIDRFVKRFSRFLA